MAIITLPQTSQSSAVLPRQYLMVQIKRKWADPWKTAKYLSLISMVDEVAPAVSQATFVWHWGTIKFEDSSVFTVTGPKDIADWFVRVGMVVESESLSLVPETLPVFVGVIAPSTHELLGDGSTATGADQTLTAFGLLHLLDRVTIDQSWVLPFASPAPIAIDRLLDINQKMGGGYDTAIGNRSSAKYDGPHGTDLGQSYVFSDDGQSWTLGDYVQYLLVHYPPGGPDHGDINATLSGQADILKTITLPRQAQRWRTLKEALDDLISSRRGLGYTLRLTDTTDGSGGVTGSTLSVHVFSTAARPIKIAGSTLQANAEKAIFDPAQSDQVRATSIQIDPTAQYDKLIVRGKPILSCFTLSFDDATIRKGWLAADETTYLAGDAAIRASDAMRHVFRLYTVKADWDWFVGNGQSVANLKANPGCNQNGVITDTIVGPNRKWGYRFERYLPLPKVTSEITQPELLEPLAWLKDANGRYYQVDVPPDDSDLPGCAFSLVRTGLAFELSTDPAHLIALNHTALVKFDQAPAVDYETLTVTMAVRTDVRLQVTNVLLQSFSTTRPGRTRIIDVPDAEAWYIVPGSVIGLYNQNVSFLRHAGGLVRDDSPLLRQIATIARAWYGTPRAIARISFDGITLDYPLASMIRAVVTGLNDQDINTVVTRRKLDIAEGQYVTTIETGFEDINFAQLDQADPSNQTSPKDSQPVRSPKTNPLRPPARYRVKTVNADHLVCVTWDGTTQGTDNVLIARPESCRTDNLAAFSTAESVVFVDTQTVVATGTVNAQPVSEVWRITPAYVPDQTDVYAVPVRRGAGTVTDYPLVDTNRDARQWVATTETPKDLTGGA